MSTPPAMNEADRIIESNMDDTWRSREAVIVAETGCDIKQNEARDLGIYLVPMHVIFGADELTDGAFSPECIESYRRKTGKLPHTSACSIGDFCQVFEQIRKDHPEKTILHLAYSAQTTASFAAGVEAARDIPGVLHVDTRAVSSGQGAIVREIAHMLKEAPGAGAMQVAKTAIELSNKLRFGFVPGGLEYLRAGGRLSNAAYVGSSVLRIRPIVEVVDGKLVATKKVPGSMRKAALALVNRIAGDGRVDPRSIFLLRSPGLNPFVAEHAQDAVRALGCPNPTWYETGGMITCHCGPGTIGIGCFTE